jgi:hypothetical protein
MKWMLVAFVCAYGHTPGFSTDPNCATNIGPTPQFATKEMCEFARVRTAGLRIDFIRREFLRQDFRGVVDVLCVEKESAD